MYNYSVAREMLLLSEENAEEEGRRGRRKKPDGIRKDEKRI